MTPLLFRMRLIRSLAVAMLCPLASCIPMVLPQPGAEAPTEPATEVAVGYLAPSDGFELIATPQPTELEPTVVPPDQFFHGSEVVTDGQGYYSVTVPENWVAMSSPGMGYVRLADYDMEKTDPPTEGALSIDLFVVDLPLDRDIKGILTDEVELGRRNPDGLVGPTPVTIEDVVEMRLVGLEGVGYRAYPPETLNFAAVIDKEHYILVRTFSTWAKDAPSLKVLDTLIVTLH